MKNPNCCLPTKGNAGSRVQIQNNIKRTSMNDVEVPLFPETQLSQEQIETLKLLNSEAECEVFAHPKHQMFEESSQDKVVLVVLVLTQGYVVQMNADKSKIISAMQCHYDMQFEIIRKPSQIPNRIGDVVGIRFMHRDRPDKLVQLMVKPENKGEFERFYRILSKNYVVQLGFHACFKANKKIGKGMTACVYNAINLANGRQVAIKSFKRSVYFAQDNGNGKLSFMKEFKILTEVSHRNICQLYSVFETENSTYVILELYPLSLYGYLQKCGFPNIDQAKVIMINLLEGILYLHKKGIMHRDLKLENIMVKRDDVKSDRVIPVIVDFGLAEYLTSTKYLYTRCGTPGYVAPEVLKIKSTDPVQTYSCACDIFSLGVIFHILLFKKPVFEGKDVKEVIKKNSDCDINFSSENFSTLGELGQDLLSQMLCRDPAVRITAEGALNHPFLVEERKKMQLQAEQIFHTSNSILV